MAEFGSLLFTEAQISHLEISYVVLRGWWRKSALHLASCIFKRWFVARKCTVTGFDQWTPVGTTNAISLMIRSLIVSGSCDEKSLLQVHTHLDEIAPMTYEKKGP